MANGRDNCGSTRSEYFVQLASVVCVGDFLNGDTLLAHLESPLLAKLDRGLSCDTREDRALKHGSYNLAVNNEEDVHCTYFFYVLSLNAVKPEHL